MRNILQNTILVFAAGVLLSGCAVKVQTAKLIPASSTKVTTYKNVAVLEFTGNIGTDVSREIETLINNTEVNGKKQFKLVDRTHFDTVLKEQKFQMTMANEDSIVKLGELLGVEAMWSGHAIKKEEQLKTYEDRRTCGKYDNKGVCTNYYNVKIPCVTNIVSVSVIPKLISVSTGEIVYSDTFIKSRRNHYCKDSSYVPDTTNQLYLYAVRDVLKDFRIAIAPYVEHVNLYLMDSTKDIEDKKAKELLKSGLKYAKENRLDRACQLWTDGLKKEKNSISLLYNVGICYELENNYEVSLKYFNKADKAAGKPIDQVTEAIERSKEGIERTKTLKKQLK